MGAPKGKRGKATPSIRTPKSPGKGKALKGAKGTSDEPEPPGSDDGPVVKWDGNIFPATNYPKVGGPWIQAWQPNGSWVWVNAGGLV